MRIKGADQVISNLRRFGADADREVRRVVATTTHRVRSRAVREIQRAPATGRVYEKYTPNRTHQASAPGEPPATDTGALASSISAIFDNPKQARVGTPLTYGAHLEFGTTRMDARPWLWPSLQAVLPDHERRINQIFNRAVKGIIE